MANKTADDVREMLKAKQSANSFMSFFSNVLFPAPEGPHITTSRVIIVLALDKDLLRKPERRIDSTLQRTNKTKRQSKVKNYN